MRNPLVLTVRDGLGGRVASMANGLSSGRALAFGWAVNADCPLPHEVVFPNGIQGVTFTEPDGDCELTDWNGQPFFSWSAAADRPTANAVYARIMQAMCGAAREVFSLGVCVRFFRNPHVTVAGLAAHVRAVAGELNCGRVFVMADRHREALAEALPGLALRFPECGELTADLARTEGDTLSFISDWKTLLAAHWIVAPEGVTTMLHPARAAGVRIIYPEP